MMRKQGRVKEGQHGGGVTLCDSVKRGHGRPSWADGISAKTRGGEGVGQTDIREEHFQEGHFREGHFRPGGLWSKGSELGGARWAGRKARRSVRPEPEGGWAPRPRAAVRTAASVPRDEGSLGYEQRT